MLNDRGVMWLFPGQDIAQFEAAVAMRYEQWLVLRPLPVGLVEDLVHAQQIAVVGRAAGLTRLHEQRIEPAAGLQPTVQALRIILPRILG